MRIEEYPRPKHDQGMGLLWTEGSAARDPRHILERARELDAQWLVIPTALDRPVATSILRELVAEHLLEVVVGLEEQVRPLPQDELRRVLQGYAQSGIRYLYVYREPNQMASWPSGMRGEFMKPQLPQRFVEILSPSLQRVAELGMIPLFPPLKPGGDYWDLAFLADALQELSRQEGTRERLGLAIANHFSTRPPSWGRGGRVSWPQARPYHTPKGSEDHRGFHLFEWYDQVVREQVGTSLPLIATGYPATAAHEEWARDVLAWVNRGSRPDYLFVVNLGPIDQVAASVSPRSTRFHESASGINQELSPSSPAPHPLEMDELLWPDQPRQEVAAPILNTDAKAIGHYLLFPSWEWGISDWHWQLAFNYVRRFRPTCGFDAQEAASAKFVTILGDGRGIDEATEQQLRAQGCRVERIPGEDAAQIKRTLDELARSGRRFVNQEVEHGR